MTIKVDRPLLITLMKATHGKTKYGLGKKPLLKDEAKDIKSADCSGYVRWLLNKITHGALKLKAWGSDLQRSEIKAMGFARCDYADCGKLDNILRIAFIKPTEKHGHIWLTCNGMTVECAGGMGAGRRIWNTPVLLHEVTAAYVLSEPMP
jgi:hypothetical protein